MSVKVDFKMTKEGIEKTRMVKNIPKAHGKQLTTWGKNTVRKLKEKGGGGILTVQSGHLRRNIGMLSKTRGNLHELTVGTGVGVLKQVKYADILDRGGTINAKRRTWFKRKGKRYQFKNGPYLYIPIYGGGMRHKGEPKSFRLVKSVRIHPFGWFRKTIKRMRPELDRMQNKREVLKVAKGMK